MSELIEFLIFIDGKELNDELIERAAFKKDP